MADELITPEALNKFVGRAIGNPKLLKKVREFLGPDSLTDARVRNWAQPGRGIPDQIVLGAALMMLADDEDLYGKKAGAPPSSLLQDHRDALNRTKMWAESVWHVFWVDDKPQRD